MLRKNEILNEEYIGFPVKVSFYQNVDGKSAYIYGRYYGRGIDGNSSLIDKDANIITVVTPDNNLIRCDKEMVTCSDDAFEKLEEAENVCVVPYSSYFKKINGKYYKKEVSYEENEDLYTLFKDKRYLTVDAKLFGNALSLLFTKYYGKKYYFNKVAYKYKGKSSYGLKYHDIAEVRFSYEVSVREVNGIIKYHHHYNGDYDVPFIKEYNEDPMFKCNPLIVGDAYVVKFCESGDNIIELGTIVKGEFVPRINDAIYSKGLENEINYDNTKFDIVEDFILEIINYKIIHHKPNLEEKDFYEILKKYGISKQYEMTNLVRALNILKQESQRRVLESNTVASSLVLNKKSKRKKEK